MALAACIGNLKADQSSTVTYETAVIGRRTVLQITSKMWHLPSVNKLSDLLTRFLYFVRF